MSSKNEQFKYISRLLFYIGMFILSFIFFNILVSSLLLIFKISINIYNSFIALMLSSILNFILIKKSENNPKWMYFITIIISISLIIFSIFTSGKLYDYSTDGNSYHKSTIGTLVRGWNPIYENLEDFDHNSLNPMNIKWNSYMWANHYAKASHIYAANIVIVTNNIETGKSINILSIIMLFVFIFSFLLYKSKNIFFSLLFSISSITCATISTQFLTNYIDILVYIYFFVLIMVFFLLEKSELFSGKKEVLIIYFMTLVIAINLKFSLFAYAGVFCLGYYLWYIYRLLKKEISKKNFIQFTIISIIAVLLAVGVIGLSVYPKNYLENGNPFYPLMGENKIDIMTMNQPNSFKGKTPIEKFMISTFSKSSNAMGIYEPVYKLPFFVSGSEINNLYAFDLRIGGNGVFFSVILILSVVLFIMNLYRIFKSDKTLFFLMIIPTVITFGMIFLMDDVWWARYFPQIHLVVFFSLITLYLSKNDLCNKILYMLLTIILMNNFMVFSNSLEYAINFTSTANSNYNFFEKNSDSHNCNLNLYSKTYDGALYNITEKYGDYKISFISENEYNKNPNDYRNFLGGFILWKCG